MSSSIRTFLLINLLLSVALITSFSIIGNLILSHKDIERQMDNQLINVGIHLNALFSTGIKPYQLQIIQDHLEQEFSNQKLNTLNEDIDKQAYKPLALQLWEEDELLLRSFNAPHKPLSNGTAGISTIKMNHEDWRVNTIINRPNDLTIMLAEESDSRRQLENQLTKDTIIITLFAYPFLGTLIWLIVGRALNPLKRIAKAVSHRAPGYLAPVDIRAIPSEILPIVEELNHLFSRLKDAFDREKRFTADAAHELKTPLAAINAQTQVALYTKDDTERKAALEKIIAGVDRSTHVIHQLLTLSRMVPEATLEKPTTVHLTREATDVAVLLAPNAIAKNIELELLNPDSKATIQGNAAAIGILIRNLLDNAIRYTPKGGHVTIDIKENINQVILSVADTGPGIPQELRERVFERFYRIVGNTSPGSGLGLGIVQQIVHLHQGKIQLLTPKSGQGLKVQVIFPKQ